MRIVVLYEELPDPDRFATHAELCRQVPGSVFRHGAVRRTLFGREIAYYAEWEFESDRALRDGSASPELKAAAADSAAMGVPHSVHIVELQL